MWKIDPNLGQQFRDPRDPGQLTFGLDAPNLAPLKAELTSILRRRSTHISVKELRQHTLLETIYRKPHASTALRELRDEGIVVSEPRRIADDSKIRLAAG